MDRSVGALNKKSAQVGEANSYILEDEAALVV
jgi:hypothetical protein